MAATLEQLRLIQGLPENERARALAAIDWTVDPKTGRSNSSAAFVRLSAQVEATIRNHAYSLINGEVGLVAQGIMAELAHVHLLTPSQAYIRAAEIEADQKGA